MGCGLSNRVGKPVFKPKERDSCALYKFVIIIVISSPIALVVTNVLIIVDVTSVLIWPISLLYVIYSVIIIRVVDIRRETVV
jgi:hypothetical protein